MVVTKRLYHFQLPYHLTAVTVFYAENELKSNGLWEHLSKDLRIKIDHAKDEWHPLTVTAEELDELDDRTWSYIANKLHLRWEHAK